MEESEVTFWTHLEALRRVLMRVSGVLLVVLVGCFAVMPDLFDRVILAPATSDFPL